MVLTRALREEGVIINECILQFKWSRRYSSAF